MRALTSVMSHASGPLHSDSEAFLHISDVHFCFCGHYFARSGLFLQISNPDFTAHYVTCPDHISSTLLSQEANSTDSESSLQCASFLFRRYSETRHRNGGNRDFAIRMLTSYLAIAVESH